jgi:hypothetical protein
MTSTAAPEPVFFADAEAAWRTYLDGLVDVPVSVHVPNPRPDSFVRVIRTGGPRANVVVDDVQLTFECWAGTTVAAAALASVVRAHVNAAQGTHVGGVWCGHVREMGGPGNLPDPSTDQYRYSWSVMAAMRGTP